MIDEAFVRMLVRNVLERLQGQSLDSPHSELPFQKIIGSDSPSSEQVGELYQSYRDRYLTTDPSEERFLIQLESSLSIEINQPLGCIFESHLPCDSCGRCQVRGF
jgi:hypothetical protein